MRGNMSDQLKKEAIRQYLRHFRVLFIITGIVAVIAAGAGVAEAMRNNVKRANNAAPVERVYDNAGILTDAEKEELRNYIAKKEAKYKADFVILTVSQPVEGEEALEYGCPTSDWESNMTALADDFWDENGYGFNKAFEGDGSILIDNRYEGQRGEWLSTSGKVEDSLSIGAVESVLYAVDDYYDSDPCRAYMCYIDTVCGYLDGGRIKIGGTYYLGVLFFSVVIAGVYAAAHLGRNKARDTTTANAYVAGGKPVMNNVQDEFIRKDVVKRRIETSSGGSGGGSSRSSGGGGGHHVSRSGASHGGGGHRH